MVADTPKRAYNRRRKSGGLGEVDWLVNALEPLSKGKTKVLVMDTPAIPRKGRKDDSTTRHQLVALAPGTLYGFKQGSVLVSIIGAGSCVVVPSEPKQLTPLLRAGIPPKLAKALIDGLARLDWSNDHGTNHPPKPHGRTFAVSLDPATGTWRIGGRSAAASSRRRGK